MIPKPMYAPAPPPLAPSTIFFSGLTSHLNQKKIKKSEAIAAKVKCQKGVDIHTLLHDNIRPNNVVYIMRGVRRTHQ